MNQEDKIRKAMIALRQSYELLATMLPESKGAEINNTLESEETVIKIRDTVTKVFGVDPMQRNQKEEVVLARHAYRFLLRFITQKTLKQVGLISGTVDHRSVVNSINNCRQLSEQYKWYAKAMEQCKKHLAAEIKEASEIKELKFLA